MNNYASRQQFLRGLESKLIAFDRRVGVPGEKDFPKKDWIVDAKERIAIKVVLEVVRDMLPMERPTRADYRK